MEMEWDLILRLCVAGLCGTVIGLDREYRVKDAGFRTHFLVALGSALMMIVSQYGFEGFLATHDGLRLDPSRIAAQVVSGIGFIGAGTIIIHRQLVRGLTTAASLWATAGIGLAAGGHMYVVAGAATLLTLFALEVLTLFFGRLGRRRIMVVFSAADRKAIDAMFNRKTARCRNSGPSFSPAGANPSRKAFRAPTPTTCRRRERSAKYTAGSKRSARRSHRDSHAADRHSVLRRHSPLPG